MEIKKHILLINTLYSPHISGGAEIILKIQAESLKERGYDVTILATGPEKGLNVEVINDIKVYRAGLKNLYFHYPRRKKNKFIRMGWHLRDIYNCGMKKYVREVINSEHPNLVICHNLTGWSASVLDEIYAADIPSVLVLHDPYFVCANSSMFKNGKACDNQCTSCKMLRYKHRDVSNRVTALVGVSSYIVNRVSKLGYFENASKHIIHNARAIHDIGPNNKSSQGQALKFGYLGTLSSTKGVDWLIKQFQSVNIDATLDIAGDGAEDYVDHLHKIRNSDKIKFLGYTNSEDFFKSIDVLVVPSIWPDTFPGVAYEACAYHVPVIASNMGGLPEIIKEKVNGLLCDPLDRNSLGRCIVEVSEDANLYNSLSANARESVKQLLDPDRWFNEFDSLVQSLVK